jgi:hypothetical protein
VSDSPAYQQLNVRVLPEVIGCLKDLQESLQAERGYRPSKAEVVSLVLTAAARKLPQKNGRRA